jgi:hypothetical protein
VVFSSSLVGPDRADADQRFALVALVAEIRLLEHHLLRDRRVQLARQPLKLLQ